MKAAHREGMKKRAADSEHMRLVDEFAGDMIILPATAFDADQIPDVDIRPCLVEDDGAGEGRVPIPRHLPQAWVGGLHIVAPHHIAMMWADLKAETLRQEVALREENDMPIPEIAHQRLEREVYR